MTEWLHFHFSLSCFGEGNGNPLQCSCLENPRDRGAWWAAVYGVAQSQTRLKWLSSSSSIIAKNNWNIFSKSVQSLSCVRLFATPWTTASQASLSITSSRSPPKPMSIESVMSSNHLILYRPLLLALMFPSIRVFSNESALHIRWPKYWSFSFSISPSNEHSDWSPLGWTDCIYLQSNRLSRVFSNTIVQKHQFFCAQLSL